MSKRLISLAVLIASGTFLFVSGMAFAEGTPAVSSKDIPWSPTVEFGGKAGTKRHVWEIDTTIPLFQDEDSLLFADLRGRMDDDGSEEGNFGLGWRHVVHGGEGIFGVYGFYDVLHSSFNNTYHQATFGSEYLWEGFELRGNAYLPERGTRSTGSGVSGANIVGNQIFVMAGGGEEALPGFDIEAGLRIPGTEDLWLRAALFHFSADGDAENVTGPRLSAEWGVDLGRFVPGTELTLGGEWQEDDIRGSQAFATARLRIPLGPAPATRAQAPSWRYSRMQEKIRRDVDIVVAQGAGSPTPALDPETGEEFGEIYFADGDGDTDNEGTLEDPTDLYSALELAGEDGVVVALGDAGDVEFYSATVQDGSKLLGGGSTLMVSGGGGMTGLTLPGSRPNLVAGDGIELDEGAGNLLLKGFDLEADGTAIDGEYNHDVTIDDVSIAAGGGEGGDGIRLDYASGSVTITNSTLSAPDGDAIFIMPDYEDSVDVLIQDNVITGYNGVYLSASDSASINAEVIDNDIDVDYVGVWAEADGSATVDLLVRDNVIAADYAVDVSASYSADVTATITGNTLTADTNAVYAYVYEEGASVDLLIEDNVMDAEGDAIYLSASSSTASLAAEIIDNEINSDQTGIYAYAYYESASVDLLIEDNVINAEDGIDLSAASSSASIAAEIIGNEINAGDTAIQAYAEYGDASVDVLIEDNVINAYDGIDLSAYSSSANITAEIIDNDIDVEGTGIYGYAEYGDATVDVVIRDNVITAGEDGIYLSAYSSSSSSSASITADITGNSIDADGDDISLNGYSDVPLVVNLCPPALGVANDGASVSISGDVEDGDGSCVD